MKKIGCVIIIVLGINVSAFAQHQYEIIREKNGTKILKGLLTKEDLSKDSTFVWYVENQKGYIPDTAAVEALKKNGPSLQIMAFVGTWCGDTKFIIPKFFGLLDAASFAESKVTLIGVDRSKKTTSHLAEALNIINVPTIIVMKDGKEIGRVVEYGKYGMFDKELGEIINTVSAKIPPSR